MEIIVNIIPPDLVTKLILSSFCSFLQTKKKKKKKKKLGFQQVDGLVMRKISIFCLWRVTLYFKAMSDSIDFYKGISLHVFLFVL